MAETLAKLVSLFSVTGVEDGVKPLKADLRGGRFADGGRVFADGRPVIDKVVMTTFKAALRILKEASTSR